MTGNTPLIEEIRASSRLMVRELGFMNATLAATSYSPSAVHTLLEIDAQGAMTAAQLVQLLGLEKSSVSRMLGKLIDAGELEESTTESDGRFKPLCLTTKGKRTAEEIHAYAHMQVETALQHLTPSQQQTVARGISSYAQALKTHRTGEQQTKKNQIQIESGYRPGLVGRIAEMHASFYAKNWGFGQYFESRVASGAADFVGRLAMPCNAVWLAILNDRIVGSIAIDGEDLGNGEAHLRWFILDDSCRGSGAGKVLLEKALAFCDQHGFSRTQLWTFKGLTAARHLYESHGFVLGNEEEGSQWGSTVTEQQFTRINPLLPHR